MASSWRDEVKLLSSIKASIEARLTGEDEPEVIDGEPGRRFSVAILNASPEAEKANGAIPRRPESVGFSVRLDRSRDCRNFKVGIRFSVYYRVRPTLSEQKGKMSGEIADQDEIPVVPKYRRLDQVVEGTLNLPDNWGERSDVDCDSLNQQIGEIVEEMRRRILQDADLFPRPGFRLRGADLRSEASYAAATDGTKHEKLPTWRIRLHAEVIRFSAHDRLSILLVNHSEPSDFGVAWHPPEVFGARINLTGQKGCFSPERFSPVRNDYRYQTETWGKGVNCVLAADNDSGEAWTEHMPVFQQPRSRSRSGFDRECDTKGLSGNQAIDLLERVQNWLDEYASRWDEHINSESDRDAQITKAMQADLGAYRREVDRFRLGVSVLNSDPMLMRAFALMNRAFAQAGLSSWRLFQLSFIVSMMPSLHARQNPAAEFAELELGTVDVLWFPTGGGKTEAFFGVIVAALFYDRLRGKEAGVTAWLRYPLRMLSIQQLQRLVDVIVRAEEVRSEEADLESAGEPFAVGYYVGSQNSPNELTFPGRGSGEETIDKLFAESERDELGLIRFRVLEYCPKCRSDKVKVEVDQDRIRIEHVCQDCGFRPPVLISDSEIYRYLPSVLVGTVDRLARAGQTDLFSIIFRGPTSRCPTHGYAPFGECVESKRCMDKRRVQSVPEVYDPCPSLLMQDEIHLLRESLGTYDSHYEGLLDVIARKVGTGLIPKRMAATATIEGLEQHIYQLYVARARAFPVKGMDLDDSAYVEKDEGGSIGRLYVGVLPSGRDADDVSQTIAVHLAALAENRFQADSDDPDYDLLLVYVNEKNTASDIRAYWPEDVAVQVLTGDKTLEEVRRVLSRARSDGGAQHPDRLHGIIATSMISHGVDLERLNEMVIVGMPRSVAEYIQSSSRVGRSHVGVVFTVFRWRNRRDVSMYEHFHEVHERMYQLVQPVPVNRMSASSLERTVTGLLASVVYNLYGPQLYEAKRIRLQSATKVTRALADKDLIESELVSSVAEAYFHGYDMMPSYRSELMEKMERIIKIQLQLLPTRQDWSFHMRLQPTPVSSLREVGEQVNFGMDLRDLRTTKLVQRRRLS